MSLLAMGVITLVILQTSVFFTTIYLHRCKTHRGLELHPIVGFLMHLELALFTGIVPRQWAAVHRKHHHFSDVEGDPHSPYLRGMWTVLFGNYFMYHAAASDAAMVAKYTPDWKDDVIDCIPHGKWIGRIGGILIFTAMFGIWWGFTAWFAHVVLYIFLNSSINSVCHMVGYRNFPNKATNLQSIALLTAGEGLHNNHHAYPSRPKMSVKTFEYDPAWVLIRVLESCGLAKAKNVVPMRIIR
ncbi:MAG: fatty acid desaturase [Candidatus Doudnabacteria bacterium]|nr:fatty acid desaturase [Candidatus Doudnabacteria bacterium]